MTTRKRTLRAVLLSVGAFALLLLPVWAQQQPVTDDDVDAVAERMYCPVCENEPLDDCRTPTCMEWKEEIREQLAAGMTPEEIIADFVATHGQHVVGVPTDPLLRTLSLAAPIIGLVLALLVAGLTFYRWQQGQRLQSETVQAMPDKPKRNDDPYRNQLEQDLGL